MPHKWHRLELHKYGNSIIILRYKLSRSYVDFSGEIWLDSLSLDIHYGSGYISFYEE